jgi:hypothetical protein
VKDKLRNGEYSVCGDQWPIFLYHGYTYNKDDPWNGLFRSSLLIKVSTSITFVINSPVTDNVKAYKHVFTSPSSVDREPKATRSGNARIHGMTQVTTASIAYIATQVRRSCASPSYLVPKALGSLCVILLTGLLTHRYCH